jgi:TRAP-type C4-dicarboxylate transport system substrate-binding protein
MKTFVKVIQIGAQEVLVTNSAFFNQIPPAIAKEVLDLMEEALREKRPQLFEKDEK